MVENKRTKKSIGIKSMNWLHYIIVPGTERNRRTRTGKKAALSGTISESRVTIKREFMQRHVTRVSVITGALNQPIIYPDYLDQYTLF